MERKKYDLDVASTRMRCILFYLTLILLPLLAGVICLCIGRFATTPAETLAALGRILTRGVEQGDNLAKIIRDMRLPRIAMAILVGGGLSAAGLAFQSLFGTGLGSILILTDHQLLKAQLILQCRTFLSGQIGHVPLLLS